MWWLQLVGVTAFAVLVVVSFLAWRRNGARPGTSRAYMIGLFVVAFALLTVGAFLVAATYPG